MNGSVNNVKLQILFLSKEKKNSEAEREVIITLITLNNWLIVFLEDNTSTVHKIQKEHLSFLKGIYTHKSNACSCIEPSLVFSCVSLRNIEYMHNHIF